MSFDVLVSVLKDIRIELPVVTPVRFLRTGIATLDLSIGGGLPLGMITELGGEKSNGKTTTALNIAGYVISKGGNVVFLNNETPMPQEWTSLFGVEFGKNALCFNMASGTQIAEMMFRLISISKGGNIRLIVLDSLANMYPERALTADELASGVATRASLLSQFLPQFRAFMSTYGQNTAVLFLNQVRKANVGRGVSYGWEYYLPGGEAKEHAVVYQARLNKPRAGKRGDVDTITYNGKAMKNKISGVNINLYVNSDFEYDAYPSRGIMCDRARALLDVAKKLELFSNSEGLPYSGAGTAFFEGEELGKSKDAIAQRLHADPDLFERVYDAMEKKLGHIEP